MKIYLGKIVSIIDLLPKKKYSLWLIGTNIITIIVALVLSRSVLPPIVPLYYGNPSGSEQLANSSNLIIPPFTALVLSLSNLAVGGVTKDEFIKNILFGGAAIVTLLSLITVAKIILLVGNINVI